MYGPVEVADYIPLTSSSIGRDKKMTSLHEAMTMALQPLFDNAINGFLVLHKNFDRWHQFLSISSYFCDIPEAKDMSGVRHNFTPRRPCVRCLATTADMKRLHYLSTKNNGMHARGQKEISLPCTDCKLDSYQ